MKKIKLHLPETYSNAHPAPPSPNVEHIVEDDRLDLAIAEVAFESARVAREFFVTEAFQCFLTGQAEHLRAVGAFRVAGVYLSLGTVGQPPQGSEEAARPN